MRKYLIYFILSSIFQRFFYRHAEKTVLVNTMP